MFKEFESKSKDQKPIPLDIFRKVCEYGGFGNNDEHSNYSMLKYLLDNPATWTLCQMEYSLHVLGIPESLLCLLNEPPLNGDMQYIFDIDSNSYKNTLIIHKTGGPIHRGRAVDGKLKSNLEWP